LLMSFSTIEATASFSLVMSVSSEGWVEVAACVAVILRYRLVLLPQVFAGFPIPLSLFHLLPQLL